MFACVHVQMLHNLEASIYESKKAITIQTKRYFYNYLLVEKVYRFQVQITEPLKMATPEVIHQAIRNKGVDMEQLGEQNAWCMKFTENH